MPIFIANTLQNWYMSQGEYGVEIEGNETTCDDRCQKLAKSILHRFSHISVQRFHKLAYLSEYKHYTKTQGDRLTPAIYVVKMDGCYSEELEDSIRALEGVEQNSVKIAGERVNTLEVSPRVEDGKIDTDCEPSCVNEIVDEYGEIGREEIDKELKENPLYQETKLGHQLIFDRLRF